VGGRAGGSAGIIGTTGGTAGGSSGRDGSAGAGGRGTRTGGRSGSTGGAGGGTGGSWGTGGTAAGGAGGAGPAMCDPSIRDKDSCDFRASECRKTCGVSALATKPCTCTAGQWNCGDCVYPAGDYSCYQLDKSFVPSCPSGTSNGTTTCTGICSLCSGYQDTTGTDKVGYCSCTDPGGNAPSVYRCASTSEWPPQ
jgi:hypothetical protein